MSGSKVCLKFNCSNEASTNAVSEVLKLILKLKLTKEEVEKVKKCLKN